MELGLQTSYFWGETIHFFLAISKTIYYFQQGGKQFIDFEQNGKQFIYFYIFLNPPRYEMVRPLDTIHGTDFILDCDTLRLRTLATLQTVYLKATIGHRILTQCRLTRQR